MTDVMTLIPLLIEESTCNFSFKHPFSDSYTSTLVRRAELTVTFVSEQPAAVQNGSADAKYSTFWMSLYNS